METKTVKLAYYQDMSSEYGSPTVFECGPYFDDEDSDYTRLTDPVEVTFNFIRDEHEIVLLKVAALRAKKAQFNAKIDEKISKLLALPNPEDFGVEVEDAGGAR